MNNIRIHRQNRRSLVMKRTPVGLVVFIPRWLKPDSPQVRRFIDEGIAKLGTPAPAVEQTSAAELRALVAAWAERLGVQPGRVQVRDMYRKWGSCSSKGSITLNTALCSSAPRSGGVRRAARTGASARLQSRQRIQGADVRAHAGLASSASSALDALLRQPSI